MKTSFLLSFFLFWTIRSYGLGESKFVMVSHQKQVQLRSRRNTWLWQRFTVSSG
jgi:hypothetical protein